MLSLNKISIANFLQNTYFFMCMKVSLDSIRSATLMTCYMDCKFLYMEKKKLGPGPLAAICVMHSWKPRMKYQDNVLCSVCVDSL